jgi:hypothetical protein
MIGIPFHSAAVAGISVGGKGVPVGADVAVKVTTAVRVEVGTGIEVGWAELEQAVRTSTNKNKRTVIGLFTKPSFSETASIITERHFAAQGVPNFEDK